MTQRRCAKCNLTEMAHKYTISCTQFEPKQRKPRKLTRIQQKSPEEVEEEVRITAEKQVSASDKLLALLIQHHGEQYK